MKVISFIKVTWTHLFYKGGIMKDLTVMPTAQTAKFMQKAGLFCKMKLNELEIACNPNRIKLFLEDESLKILLTFEIKNSNPYFQGISDIPMYLPHKNLFYFNNLNKVITKDDEPIQLAKAASKLVSHKDLFEIKSIQFQFKTEGEARTSIGNIKISNPLGEVLGEYKKEAEPKPDIFRINLQQHAPDLFTIEQEDTEEKEEAYCFASVMSHSFGRLHIYIDKTMLVEEAEVSNTKNNFQIQFSNRKTLWRYYFIGDRLNNKSDILITHPEYDISFKPAKPATLNNGIPAWKVISTQPIPLLEESKHNFSASLILDAESGRRENILLPNPDLANVRGEGREQAKKFILIFTYTCNIISRS